MNFLMKFKEKLTIGFLKQYWKGKARHLVLNSVGKQINILASTTWAILLVIAVRKIRS